MFTGLVEQTGILLARQEKRLTVREPEDWTPQPKRLVVSREMSDEDVAEFFPDGNVRRVAPESPAAWNALLEELGREECMVLLIEGGGQLADCVLRAGIVDYVEFHIAPKRLGGRNSIPVLGGQDPVSLADALELHQIKVRFFGSDIAVSGYTGE